MAFKRSAVRSRYSPPKGYEKGLVFTRKQALSLSKNTYRDDVGTIHRHLSVIPKEGSFYDTVKAALFLCPNAFHDRAVDKVASIGEAGAKWQQK